MNLDGMMAAFTKPRRAAEEVYSIALSPVPFQFLEDPPVKFREADYCLDLKDMLPLPEAWVLVLPQMFPWKLWGYCLVDVVLPGEDIDWQSIAQRAATYLSLEDVGAVRLGPLPNIVRASLYFGDLADDGVSEFASITPPVQLEVYLSLDSKWVAFLEASTRMFAFIFPVLDSSDVPALPNPVCLLPALESEPGVLCAIQTIRAMP